MTIQSFLTIASLVVSVGVAPLGAQTVISARSGLIHYVEGRVYLNGEAVEPTVTNFPEVKEKQVLRTEQGRAEVLLGPGTFLRIGESSSFRMISNRLIDTRLEQLTGSLLIECVELPKDNAATVAAGSAAVSLIRKGLYRFDSNPARVRVYEGEALVEAPGQKIQLRKGQMLSLEGELVAARFDPKATDELFRWSERRAEYISYANVSAANSLRASAGDYSSAGWNWNPYFGMFTYVPFSGLAYSPFGFAYWSPMTVVQAYQSYPVSSGLSRSGAGSPALPANYSAGSPGVGVSSSASGAGAPALSGASHHR